MMKQFTFMITKALSSYLSINCNKKQKKYNNLVGDKYLQRPSHLKVFFFPIEITVVLQNNLLHPIQKYYKTQELF